MSDLRYALRLLRRGPGYAVVAVLTIALGIGATTSLFSVAYGVLLKPLPWRDADRVVRVVETRGGRQARLAGTITNGAYFAWRDRPTTIEALGGYGIGVTSVTALRAGGGDPVRLQVTGMTPSAFEVLRAAPLRGRLVTDDEVPPPTVNAVDTPRPVVISHALWLDWFGGRDDALGSVVRLDDVPHTIVGVMPASFAFPDAETRAWTPLSIPPVVPVGFPNARSMMIFGALARLRPGVSPQQAAAEATARARQAPDPGFTAVGMFGSDAAPEISVTPAVAAMTAEVRPAIVLLLAAVALLLATAVANVGALQLARTSARRRELAVRAALGAGRRQLVRQLLAESAVVAAVGAVAGLALTFAIQRVLPAVLPADFPRVHDIAVNVPVLLFAAAVAVAVGVACGLMPAAEARRVDLAHALAEDGAASATGAWRSRSARLRSIVMTVQVAVACVLLVGAALLGRSFVALTHADRGYDPSNLLTARLDLPLRTDGPTRMRIADAVSARMRATPGVVRAAAGNALPFVSLGAGLGTELPSPTDPAVKLKVHANLRMVSPEYFAALRLPLLQGRLLTDGDGASSPAIVVSRSFVQQYLGADPIGKHVPIGYTKDLRTDWQVVGVVGDMRQGGVTEAQTPDVYVSYRQVASAWLRSPIVFLIRTTSAPIAQIAALRAAVHEEDPTVALDSIATMDERVATSLAKLRLYAALLTAFALAALTIAGVGLFGLLSYAVAQRSREIGIRTALGAETRDIVKMVLGQALLISAGGVAVGCWAAFVLTRYLQAFLYGVQRVDPVSYVVVGAVVALATALACVVPARRAARLDPLIALRQA